LRGRLRCGRGLEQPGFALACAQHALVGPQRLRIAAARHVAQPGPGELRGLPVAFHERTLGLPLRFGRIRAAGRA
jgi:hypothetical protein